MSLRENMTHDFAYGHCWCAAGMDFEEGVGAVARATAALLAVGACAAGVSRWQRLTRRERAALGVIAEHKLRKLRKGSLRCLYTSWASLSSWLAAAFLGGGLPFVPSAGFSLGD